MDKETLHEVNKVMIDKISVVFWLASALICAKHKIPVEEMMVAVDLMGMMLKCNPDDITGVIYAAKEILITPDFMEKNKATEEQILSALYPDRKIVG